MRSRVDRRLRLTIFIRGRSDRLCLSGASGPGVQPPGSISNL